MCQSRAAVATPGTAFPAAVAAAAKPPDKSHPGPHASNPSCLGGDAAREARGGEGEIQAFGGSRQVFGGEGGALLGRMREGRCCPFKRRWPNRDLFSFPGRRAKPRLGAQGGEVRSWALGGGARAGGYPSFPCSLPWTGLPAQIRRPPGIAGVCAARGARPGQAGSTVPGAGGR